MRPLQGLAVDVFLQQPLAHHQPEIAPGMPPRLVGRLVDDVADVVDAARIGRAPRFQPGLAALATLPGAGGEAEDLDLHAATLERAGEDIAADRRDGDRAAAHRAGIVEQQRHHGIAEIGVAFDLEAQRLQGIGHHAGQACGVEQAFLEVEFPAAILLCHQPALQLVGKPRHGAGEVLELLVEQRPQLIEFFGRAEVRRPHHLVELLSEDLVVEDVLELFGVGAGRRRIWLVLARFRTVVLVGLGEIHLRALDFAFLFGLAGRLVLVGLGVLALPLALLGVLLVVLAALGFLVVTLFGIVALAVVEIAVGHEAQVAQQLPGGAAEQLLVFEAGEERGQRRAGALLDLLLPQIDDGIARGRDGDAGDALAQDQPEGLGERGVGLVVDLGEVLAEQPVFQHFVDVAGHAGHADAPQRLDAGLFQRIIGGPGLRLGRGALPVRLGIVAGEPHGHGIALPAGNGDVAQRRQARQVGEPRLVGGQDRTVGREAHLEVALAANGAHRGAHRRFERGSGVGLVLLGARRRGHQCSR